MKSTTITLLLAALTSSGCGSSSTQMANAPQAPEAAASAASDQGNGAAVPNSSAVAAPEATPGPVASAPAASAGQTEPFSLGAELVPRSGSKVTGKVTLTEAKGGVQVEVEVIGASPGSHGLHFHETGDCSAMDAMSAQGHFNPMKHPHGLPAVAQRHLGDLGNIVVGPDGKGTLHFLLDGATLVPSAPNSLRGKAVILHDKTDDGSQPTGNAGARIGCAVIPT